MNKTALEAAPLNDDALEAAVRANPALEHHFGRAVAISAIRAYLAALPAPAPAEIEDDHALANFDKIKDSFFASNDAMLAAPASPSPATGEA